GRLAGGLSLQFEFTGTQDGCLLGVQVLADIGNPGFMEVGQFRRTLTRIRQCHRTILTRTIGSDGQRVAFACAVDVLEVEETVTPGGNPYRQASVPPNDDFL